MKPWPLAVSPYSFLDRAKVAAWILSTDRYTMGPKVAEFEAKFSEYAGAHAVGCSSGSTANMMLFEVWKYKNPNKRPTIIVPAVTWGSSITPAIMAGYDIVFCDVNREDFCFDYDKLEAILQRFSSTKPGARKRECDVIIWPTALIGFVPDMARLHQLANTYGAELFLDSCENSMSDGILASCNMVTTSCYFAHQIVAIEFGFTFFKHNEDALLGRMFRNHGLSRSLPKGNGLRQLHEDRNPGIDPEFLFVMPGTNVRPTEINAAFGLISFAKREREKAHRLELFDHYKDRIDRARYYLPPHNDGYVPFCLPIFLENKEEMPIIKARLRSAGIDARPVVGGCLPLHPAFSKHGNARLYPTARWIHEHGFYIGLHSGITKADIDRLMVLLHV